ncbi:thiamine phosphate synthase [Paramagnetospirillum kuznetsovii]|uniref:Thiamine phosphate synthase n=1 Tax=Paramagnetospirillum kuznetsovii TaxID=2053833 RepID=A0A364P3Q6_9PROT|nr:thiamine phosphate synthase [Paramagnetospirillum kuznetsovii]RAU23745.1 thiamine phosphate synthase [Paramagnetospirillum kuznetsovii]
MTLALAARRLKSTSDRVWKGPALLLVTDSERLPDPLAAIAHLAPGSGVLLRHYDHPDRDALALAVAALARRKRLILLVAGDWRLAARLGARGLHLPEGLARRGVLAPALAWRRRKAVLLSVACHSARALGRAKALGADAALLSPAFATASHPGARPIGPVRFGLWTRRARLPVLALGGMNGKTAMRLPQGSACGLAAVGGLL